MHTIIIGEPKCPRCGCRDLREKHWGWLCFKCDYYMPKGQVIFIKYTSGGSKDNTLEIS